MKKCILIISAGIAMSAVSANAQGAQLVYDQAVDANVTGLKTDVLAKLTELLTEAQKQNKTLEDQLAAGKNPDNLYKGALDALKNDVLSNTTLLKTNDERTAMLSTADGTAVFGRSTYGITAVVNEEVTLKDGTPVQRDVTKYEIEGKMLADVDEYRRIRDAALLQKKNLSTELQKTLAALEITQDFGSIQKYGALAQVLQGQIATADRAAEQALHDMEVLDREIKIQSSASRKANAETAQLERNHNAETRSTSTYADRETQINDTKQAALDKVTQYMTSRKGKNYTGSTSKSPNLQWRKGSDTPAEDPEETPPAP